MARFRRTDEHVEDEIVSRGPAQAGGGAARCSRARVQHGLQVTDQFDIRRVVIVLGRRDDDLVDQGAGGLQRLGRIGSAEPLLQLRDVLPVDLRQTGMQRRRDRAGLVNGKAQLCTARLERIEPGLQRR